MVPILKAPRASIETMTFPLTSARSMRRAISSGVDAIVSYYTVHRIYKSRHNGNSL
jgi:hypothetical protein